MNYEYDLFEKFTDGSSLWRESVSGLERTRLRLYEMAQNSGNRFYAINLATGEILAFDTNNYAHESHAPSMTERRSKSQAA
jgi:hypothetical protein